MRKFYAATNDYASETSIGFANTWRILAFESRKSRDEFVKSATDLAAQAISRREFGKFEEPNFPPFSRNCWCLDYSHQDEEPGLLGWIYAAEPDGCALVRVNK